MSAKKAWASGRWRSKNAQVKSTFPSLSLYLRCARSYSPPRVLNVDMPGTAVMMACSVGWGGRLAARHNAS